MLRRSQRSRLSLVACLSGALLGLSARAALPQSMTVDQIIEKNIAARGGLKAWREIQTMTIAGKMDAGSTKNAQLPFVMRLKRPLKSRLELQVGGKTAVQVYDGTNGWKLRPFLGYTQAEPFTQTELETAAGEQQFDGYLIDHAAKGIKVELIGMEQVEGRETYKLRVTTKDDKSRYLWVDAQSFLEVKMQGNPRRLDGRMRNVEVFFRNYAPISGLTMPFVYETVVESVRGSHKLTIETVSLNPKLDDSAFAKPEIPATSEAATPQKTGGNK